jgi:hypothetical protein
MFTGWSSTRFLFLVLIWNPTLLPGSIILCRWNQNWCTRNLQLSYTKKYIQVTEMDGDYQKTTDLPQVTNKLYHIMLYTSPWARFELTTLMVIGTDCIGTCSCKSNYHTITTTTAPLSFWLYWQIAQPQLILNNICNK